MTSIVESRLDALVARCRREVDEGRLPGYQLAVGFDNEIVYAEAYGDAGRPQPLPHLLGGEADRQLTVLELAAEGLLDVDATVASVLPSFGETARTPSPSRRSCSTGGFPTAPIGAEAIDRQQRLDRYASWHTTWEPGTRFEYHPLRRTGFLPT